MNIKKIRYSLLAAFMLHFIYFLLTPITFSLPLLIIMFIISYTIISLFTHLVNSTRRSN